MDKKVTSHRQLQVYQRGFKAAMKLFEASKKFPPEERYSLTDQIRRSSRSCTAQIAEAWRKRRYRAAFIAKLNDSEGEAAETQGWIEYAVGCKYMDREVARAVYAEYDDVLRTLVGMINNADKWILRGSPKK